MCIHSFLFVSVNETAAMLKPAPTTWRKAENPLAGPMTLVDLSSHNPRQNKTVVSFAPHSLNSVCADAPIPRDDVQQPPHAFDIGVIAILIQQGAFAHDVVGHD